MPDCPELRTLQPTAGMPVHRLIERCARSQPDAVALAHQGRTLSYAALDRDANRLARHLRQRGVGIGDRVAACTSPSIDSVIALLAIFKAGAVYVPLNPAHPKMRLAAMLDDTQPALVLTQCEHKSLFGESDALCLDALPGEIPALPATGLDSDIGGSDPATVFYTSGTTGRPKGVRASHANLAHCIDVARQRFGFTAGDRFCAIAAFTFSISIYELIMPLVCGGRLAILDREHVLDPERMRTTLQSVTVAHIGPSLLKSIAACLKDAGGPCPAFGNLRHLSSGGDTVPVDLLHDLLQLFPDSELHVIYGCSEISLMGCSWRFDHLQAPDRTLVGRPFDNMRLRVVNDDGQAVQAGIVGNIRFAGPGVTGGYVNASERQMSAWHDQDGMRWYDTGDRGRLDKEGNLELRGRRDFQIQLRGMRIELAEIEHHLRQAPGVRDAVVMPARLAGDNRSLVGWYVPRNDAGVRADHLRAFMQARVPDYMVPTLFQRIEALPLNHNMKVDRNALPQPTLPGARDVTPPRTQLEKQMAASWQQLLHRQEIGREDNFLLLGGDSLLAMEMILRVERDTGIRLDGMDVLRESLQVLAAGGGQPRRAGPDGAAPPLRRPPVSTPLFFGPDESLYGCFHAAKGVAAGPALLVCPPLGHEHSRSQFFLKTLAVRASGAGLPVLRFDWYGTGDSGGDSAAATPGQWQSDVVIAAQRLRELAGTRELVILAARMGANLASHALGTDRDCRFLYWDPVADPAVHFERLADMHAKRLRRLLYLRNLRQPRIPASTTELLGLALHDDSLAALRDLGVDASIATCVTTDTELPGSADPKQQRQVKARCDWYDVDRIGTAITAKTIADTLYEEIMEIAR